MVTSKTAKDLTYGDVIANADGVAVVHSVDVDMYDGVVTVGTGTGRPAILEVDEKVELLNYSA
ncbi:hypothetical protein ACFY04_25900 [Streptomyces sp. NPDC001549]|uniref:hypothetical protein n=1 Tax=Streptomyces sp. NPDC001549 TaxID=3364586 RepID=UPI0036AD24D2